MKRKRKIFLLLAVVALCVLVLAGCNTHTHSYGSTWINDSSNHWKECSCGAKANAGKHSLSDWAEDSASSQHNLIRQCSVCKKVTNTARTADFYAINDFHGKVDRMSTVGGYLAQVTNDNGNTVLLNSGDMFQGSMESNSNYGKLLADCMDDIGFDCFTLGNHEFDWGLEKLSALSSQSQTPFLGANVYHWNADTKTWGTFADELAKQYVVKTLPNGLKVGIIGVIGEKQITSISSNLVQTIGFKNPADVIPALSQKLKNELNCDLVVVDAHAGSSTFLEDRSFDVTLYANAVFCAHTHREEIDSKNGVPFIQGGDYGEYVSHVQLCVDEQGEVFCRKSENVPYNNNWPNKFTVSEKIDNSNETISEEANRVLATVSGYMNKNEVVPRMVCHAIAQYAQQCNMEIDLAMVNVARNSLSGGNVTYTQLYNALPFDNVVYVAKVKGRDIKAEAAYNSIWRVSGTALQDDEYYTIALIDYLLFHQNSFRNYDYFPSAFTSGFAPVPLTKEGYEFYNYRFVTRDFLLQNGTVDVSLYTYVSDRTNVNKLETNVVFDNSNDNEPGSATQHRGTRQDPYTVADAIVKAQQNAENHAVFSYVECTVASAPQKHNSSDDAYSFTVKDAEGNTMYVYRLAKFLGANKGDNWADGELKVGDTLLIYGSLYVYNGQPQMGSGSYCVQRNGHSTN